MHIHITEKYINKILVLTTWEGKSWCGVCALNEEDQLPESLVEIKQRMVDLAKRPNASRNGKRKAVKC